MRKVKTEQLQGGEILARPVENEGGIVLYGAGAEVNDTMIRKLEAMGIESVQIEGAHETRMPKEAYEAHVRTAFARASADGLMGRLRRILEAHVDSLYGETS